MVDSLYKLAEIERLERYSFADGSGPCPICDSNDRACPFCGGDFVSIRKFAQLYPGAEDTSDEEWESIMCHA